MAAEENTVSLFKRALSQLNTRSKILEVSSGYTKTSSASLQSNLPESAIWRLPAGSPGTDSRRWIGLNDSWLNVLEIKENGTVIRATPHEP